MANKGTIFLDEIGDLDAGSQVKLLRVLQDRTYEVLGSSRTKTVDVRIVCATNKNLLKWWAAALLGKTCCIVSTLSRNPARPARAAKGYSAAG
jgi:transcriptional regulator with AAA-type ATPase domain